MSYCRFSSDNFRCDIYCYADYQGGYTTHVAGNRIVGNIPELTGEIASSEWFESYKAQMEFLRVAKREPIGLPFAGETFNDDLPAFVGRVKMLVAAGYRVPAGMIEELEEELTDL
jgi:hypothetical protein